MKKILLFIVLASSIWLASCTGPNPEETLAPEDKDVYVSNYDPSVNFANYKTYILPDSVILISNESETPEKVRTSEDVNILNAIKSEMENLGYQLVDTSQSPDLGVQVTKIALSYTGIDYAPSYYYDPFYGGYGYYYPSYYVYQVRRGSVMIDLIDLKNLGTNNQLKVVWNGQYIDGLGALSSLERTIKGVRNLFIQSTYLKQNN